ncbi:MAG TPA: cytochrome P450 [Solirubrobacteraceae bacterium]|nr:cytochrome P450 [Solirubrobacteraceae bacterium]
MSTEGAVVGAGATARGRAGVEELPPGPSEPPLVQTLWWLLRPISFMERNRRRFGDAFSVRFMGFTRPMVMLSDPETLRALYTEHRHGLPPGRTLTLMPVLGPSSVLLLEGEDHLARRRLMLPPFHGERMRSYESTMREIAEREVASWPAEEPFALHPRMQALTLEVILRAVFGVSGSERAVRLRELLPRLVGQTASTGLQLRVLIARRLRRSDPLESVQRLMREIDDLLLAEISERRSDPALPEREDILSLLIGGRFADGGAMDDRELRDQLLTLLLAGHETTATALAWTFDLLLRHPRELQRLLAELEETDGDIDGEYMRAVVAESLRLRPVVPLAGRRLTAELPTGKWTLPAGTDVTPSIWLTHMREDTYPEPKAFRPERFLDEPPSTYAWIPFGGGIRRCLGAAFAEFEMRVVLATVLRSLELEPVGAAPERIARRNVTFSPRTGTRVRVRARRPAPSTLAA